MMKNIYVSFLVLLSLTACQAAVELDSMARSAVMGFGTKQIDARKYIGQSEKSVIDELVKQCGLPKERSVLPNIVTQYDVHILFDKKCNPSVYTFKDGYMVGFH